MVFESLQQVKDAVVKVIGLLDETTAPESAYLEDDADDVENLPVAKVQPIRFDLGEF